MLKEVTLKKIIDEICLNNNHSYFIENYNFEIREYFLKNIEYYNGLIKELKLTDEQTLLFAQNIFSSDEAKSLYNNIEDYNDLEQIFIIINLDDKTKENILNEIEYDNDYFQIITESLKNKDRKEYYKKFYNIDNILVNLNDAEKLNLLEKLKKSFNKVKVISKLENDKIKYDYIFKEDLEEHQIKGILETIKDYDILYKIILLPKIQESIYLTEFLDKLNNEYKVKLIKEILYERSDLIINDALLELILNLDSKHQEEILLDENIYFYKDKLDYYKTKELFLRVKYFDKLNELIYKMIISNKMPISFLIENVKSDKVKYELIKNKEIEIDNSDIIRIFKSIESKEYIKKLIPVIKEKIKIKEILKKLPNDKERKEYLKTQSEDELKDLTADNILEIFKDERIILELLYNDNIKLSLYNSTKIYIIKQLSDEIKLEIIKNKHKLLNDNLDNELTILMSLSDEQKIKYIEENDLLSTSKARLIASLQNEKYTDYKLEKLKEFISIAKKAKVSEKVFCDIMISSIYNENVLYNILKNDEMIDRYSIRLDMITKYLPDNESYDKFKSNFLTEYIKSNEYNDTYDENQMIKTLFTKITNEDIKFNLLKVLNNNELKAEIFITLKQEKYNKEKIEFIKNNLDLDYNIIIKLLNSINNKELINNFIDSYNIDIKIKIYLLSNLKEKAFDELKTKVLKEAVELNIEITEHIIRLIKSINSNKLKLENYIILNNFELLNNFILHDDYILTEKEVIEPIINIYSGKYNLNKKHLFIFVKKYGYEILRSIENNNIQNLINSEEIYFNKLLQIFDTQETLLVEDKHIDSVLHALIQRDFRNKETKLINIFNKIKDEVEEQDFESIKDVFNQIKIYLDLKSPNYINGILDKYNLMNYAEILNLVINTSTKDIGLNIINELTNKFILEKRNDYSNTHYKEFKNSLKLEKTYEKNALLKQFLNKESAEKIKELLISIDNLTSNEINYINSGIILDCINLKKGLQTNLPKEEIFKNMKMFNNLLEKLYLSKKIDYIGNDTIKAIYNIKKDNGSLVNILKELEMNILIEKLFNDEKLYANLINHLKNYRMVGWGNTFTKLAERVDMELDESTIAAFINNYYKIDESLNKKLIETNLGLEKDKKRKITLSQFLEEAEVYGSDSYKYKILLGSEDYRLIRTNPPNNSAKMEKQRRLELSVEKVVEMYNREYITIPPNTKEITLENEKKLGFSVGNTKDIMNLTYGERTGACMRIGGHADSLFNICLSNENGFHIKIFDPNTNQLVSRVSGFRNGNTIFLNQLRNSLSQNYEDKDIIEGLKKFMNDIISQTKDSIYPIENVIISPDFAMKNYYDKKLNDLKINIKEGFDSYFYSDVSDYNAVLLTGLDEKLLPIKLGVNNVLKYNVSRQKPLKLDKNNIQEISTIINRIRMINDLLNNITLEDTIIYTETLENIENIDKIYYGEDWYVLLDRDNNIIEEFIINYKQSEKALNELNKIKEQINNIGGKKL